MIHATRYVKNMEELIKTFHLDWKLLIAQLVNFGIVVFVLWKFALKPLMKVMDQRKKEIEKSLDDAKKIEANLIMSGEEREKRILEAKKEAQRIVEEARAQGGEQGQKMIDEAKAEVQTVIAAAKEQIASEKDRMLKEVKGEVSDLVIQTTKKVLSEVVDKKMDSAIIEQSLERIKD